MKNFFKRVKIYDICSHGELSMGLRVVGMVNMVRMVNMIDYFAFLEGLEELNETF